MRGSVNGYKIETFLEKCSKKKKTVTIVKATDGKVFGGYTDLDFEKNSRKDGNKSSFLFALLENKVIKCKCINNTKEIYIGFESTLISFG
jgi:hypothetical protein